MSDGTLSFATAIDTSGYERGIEQMENATKGVIGTVENQTSKISDAINNIPRINIQISQNADLSEIERGLRDVDRVVDENTKNVRLLRQRYQELAQARNAYAAQGKKGSSEDAALAKEQKAILEVVKAREQAIDEAGKQGDALLSLEAKLRTQKKAVDDNAQSQMSMKARLRELKMELVEMEASGQRGTAAYRALQEEAARLTDAWGDAQTQASILANDQRGFAGVMSGLTGLAGGFSAATGVVALFGSESENLQKIMTKLQAVMAITMGLQQVQQTLNKDSAFSLVTLNGLKEWWNKILAAGTKEQVAATAAETADVVAQTADATATTANAAAHKAKSVAAGESSLSTTADTLSTTANTVAAQAGTVANIGLAGAFRMVGAAIKSIPVFGWIAAAIGALIAVITHFVNKSNELAQSVKEKNEMLRDSRKAYAEAAFELHGYQTQLEDFNGTQEEEKRLVEELNRKYGEQMGYCSSVSGWKETLAQRGEAYCEVLMMEAESQAVLNKATEAYINLLEVREAAKAGKYKHWWQTKLGDEYAAKEAEDEAKAGVQKWEDEYKKMLAKIRAKTKEFNLGNHVDPTKTKSAKGGGSSKSTDTFDTKEAVRKLREAEQTYKDAETEYIKRANDAVTASNIKSMKEGLEKELAQSRANTKALKDEWEGGMLALAKARKKYLHDAYMAEKGATEEGWLASDAGKKSEEQYVQDILADPDNLQMAEQYQAQLAKIESEGIAERLRIQQEYQDALVEKYGSASEKIKVLERKFDEDVMNGIIPEQYLKEAEAQLNEQISALKSADLKKALNWEEVFGNLNAVATSSLQSIKAKLKDFIRTNKDLSPEAIKSIVEAIQKIDAKLNERNPFKALKTDLAALSAATKAVKEAQKKYNKVLKEGTEEEIKNAKATLEAAQNAKQKALADATQSLKSASDKMKEFVSLGNELVDCFEAFGLEVPEQITGFISGVSKVVDALGSIDLTKPMSIITGIVGAVTGFASSIGSLFNNDAKHEKNIKKLAKQVEALEKAYDSLGDAIERAYSKDASSLIGQQNQNLEQQKKLIEQQIKEEEAKKKTDKDKIDQYKDQIEEIEKLIEENKEKAIDAIFGEDLQSAIENFASAYADAWADGTDRAKSAKDVVKSMMKQMVTESIKAAIQSSEAMERIRQKLQEFYADNVLSGWEQDYIYNMAEQLQKELDNQFAWADSLLADDSERDASKRGIATASQDSVDENNARLTTIQSHTYTLVQGMAELNRTSTAMLERLVGIEDNTSKTNTKLDDVQKVTKKIYDTVDTISTRGIKLQ